MPLPMLHYRSDGLAPGDAFSLWREIIAPVYTVERAGHVTALPGGSVNAVLLGDILANRVSFGAQKVTRSKRLVSRTPDHIVFQLWRSGGTNGDVAGRPSSYRPGQVALFDTRLEVDSLITRSDTIGFVIPRKLLDGMRLEELPRHLDPRRNSLAAAHIMRLRRQLPDLEPADVPRVTSELLRFFRRLYDPSQASDVLDGSELDAGAIELAEQAIERSLGSPSLTPDTIAAELGISRASLYRVFAPLDGVMRHVVERRLSAARAALGDPLEARSLTKLAQDCGFSSLPVFSRAFRSRFGMAPREWRADNLRRWREQRQTAPDPIWRWFHELGR